MTKLRSRVRGRSPCLPLVIMGALVLSACDGTQPTEPANASSGLDLDLSLAQAASGGSSDAFQRVDRLHVLVRRSEDDAELLNREMPFDPSESGQTASIAVQLGGASVEIRVEITLRRDADALFRGDQSVTVELGQPSSVELPLRAVPAGLAVPEIVTVEALEETVQLDGAVVFATGDTISGIEPTWESDGSGIVDVSPDGTLVSLAEGEAEVTATHEQISETVRVRVEPRVAEVTVSPSSVTVQEGRLQQFDATTRDPNGFVLDREVAWTSSDESVARIDQNGLALAVSAGTTTITAESEGVPGTAEMTVSDRPPQAPSNVRASGQNTGILVSWTDNSDNESRFRIERKRSSENTWAEVGSTGADATTFLDQTAEPGAAYDYRVRACNGAGCSAYATLFEFFWAADLTIPGGMPSYSPTGRTCGDFSSEVTIDPWTVTNTGNAPTPGFIWGIYFSTDDSIDAGDDRVGGGSVKGLGLGESFTVPETTVTVSDVFDDNDPHYLIIRVDDAFDVPESDELNNTVSGTFTCTVLG